jgi:hypothetical protein
MDIKQQTQITDQNRKEFFRQRYHHQTDAKDQLVDLDSLKEFTVICVDCCGWYYKTLFPHKSIVSMETIKTVKNFNLDRTYFDQLIDNQSDDRLGWPSISAEQCAVIFDRSPLLKYQTLEQISTVLNTVAHKYTPATILLEQALKFIDDTRLVDRFCHISALKINGYVVTKFVYDLDADRLGISFRKKVQLP